MKTYLSAENLKLPILFTEFGRWWGNNAVKHCQEDIDIIARDGNDYLLSECKRQNDVIGLQTLHELQRKADIAFTKRNHSWYVLFLKSGFTQVVYEEAEKDNHVILVDIHELVIFFHE